MRAKEEEEEEEEEEVEDSEEEERPDNNMDICVKCYRSTGNLVACDNCVRCLCLSCLKLTEVPEDDPWHCGFCHEPIPEAALTAQKEFKQKQRALERNSPIWWSGKEKKRLLALAIAEEAAGAVLSGKAPDGKHVRDGTVTAAWNKITEQLGREGFTPRSRGAVQSKYHSLVGRR